MALTVLLEARPMRAADAVPVVVHLAGLGSRPYTHAGVNDWWAGLTDAPRFSTALAFGQSGWTGGAVPTTGAISFAPSDRTRIDALAALVWEDAAVTIWTGDDAAADPVWTVALDGVVAGIATRDGVLTITVADLSKKLARPIAPDRFTGKGGIEGGSDAAERVKRRSFGRCWGVEARLLDKAANVYEVGDPGRPLASIDTVKDRGRAASAIVVVAWAGSIVATFEALKAAAVPESGAAVAPSIACVKWWTQASGPLTVDLRGEIGASYVETVAEIAVRIIDSVGLAPVNAAAAVAARPGAAGLHIDSDSETAGQALDRLLLRSSLLWLLEPAGAVRLLPIGFDAAGPVVDALDASREASYKPVTRIVLGYQRNHRPHNAGEISAVFQASDGTYADGTPIEELKPAVRGADVTSSNTAAAIFGQGAFATQSRLDLDNGSFFTQPGRFQSYPGNPGFFGAWKIAFGDGFGLDALQPGESNANRTEGRVAASFLGQGVLATLSSLSRTGGLLTGFGGLAGSDLARLGSTIADSFGAVLSNAQVITGQGISAGFSGQGAFATISQIDLSNTDRFTHSLRFAPASYGAQWFQAANVAWGNGTGGTLQEWKPGEPGANITENRTAAALLGQGALATLNFLGADRVAFKTGGGNLLRNSGLDGPTHTFTNYGGVQTLPAGYGSYNNGGADEPTVWRVVSGYGRSGGACVQVSWSVNTSTKGVVATNAGGINNLDIMRAGRTYCVSVYARGTGAAIGERMFTAFNYGPIENVAVENPPLTAQYQRYVFRLRWGTQVDRELYWSITGGNGGATLDLDDFQIEEGDTPTAYAPGLLAGELRAPLLAWDAVRLGQNVTRGDGVTVATDALLVTGLGTAAAISGQSPWATFGTPTSTIQKLGYDGNLPAGAVYLPGIAFLNQRWPDEAGSNRTETRVASAIAGQGALATRDAASYGSQVIGADKPVTFILCARGNAAQPPANYLHGLSRGDGTRISFGYDRSYTVCTFDNASGNWSARAFDVYGNGEVQYVGGGPGANNAGAMAAYLNGIPNGTPVVVFTADEPFNLRLTSGLDAAMYRCGASAGVFGSSNWRSHSAYTLVGIAGIGSGNGIEQYADGNGEHASPRSWIITRFVMVGGVPQLSGKSPNDARDLRFEDGRILQDLGGVEGGADVTSRKTAAAIVGQGGLATRNTVTYGATDIAGLPAALGSSNFLGGGAYLAASSIRSNDGVRSLNEFMPVTTGADRTGGATAAAIAGQGALATQNGVSYRTQVADLPRAIAPSAFFASGFMYASEIYHSGGAKNLDGYFPEDVNSNRTESRTAAAIVGQGSLATENRIQGDSQLGGVIAQRLAPFPGDHNFLGAGRVAWDEGNTVQSLKPGERGANVTEQRSAAAIAGQGPFATAPGGQSLDNSGLFSVPTRLRTHPLNSDYLTAASMAYASGAQLQDLQPQEGGSNRTESRTAAAIAGQGAFATAPQIGSWNVASYYNFSAFKLDYSITRSDGVSVVTEALTITQYGVAAAFAGQGTLATKNQAGAGDLAPSAVQQLAYTVLQQTINCAIGN